ncbi:MAG: nucleoside monophosphate kinase [Aquihabitans sp.]
MTQPIASEVHRQHPKLVLLGPPGSGKGTHARYLAEHLSVPHISTGELLRREIEAQTSLGREVADAVRVGSLVPDDTIVALVDRALRSPAPAEAGFSMEPRERSPRPQCWHP